MSINYLIVKCIYAIQVKRKVHQKGNWRFFNFVVNTLSYITFYHYCFLYSQANVMDTFDNLIFLVFSTSSQIDNDTKVYSCILMYMGQSFFTFFSNGNIHQRNKIDFHEIHVSSLVMSSSLFNFVVPVLQKRHLQHTIQGAANNKRGDAIKSNIPNPAKMPITWVRCQITEALEWPNLFLQGPLS